MGLKPEMLQNSFCRADVAQDVGKEVLVSLHRCRRQLSIVNPALRGKLNPSEDCKACKMSLHIPCSRGFLYKHDITALLQRVNDVQVGIMLTCLSHQTRPPTQAKAPSLELEATKHHNPDIKAPSPKTRLHPHQNSKLRRQEHPKPRTPNKYTTQP